MDDGPFYHEMDTEESEKEERIRQFAEKSKIVAYKNINIIKSELEMLTELNEIMGKEIPIISSYSEFEFGVIIEGNHVVGLSLHWRKTAYIPSQ